MAQAAVATDPTGSSSVKVQHGQVKEGSHAPDQSKDNSRRAAAAKPNNEMAETALATAPTGHHSGNSSVEVQHGQIKEGSHAPDQSKDDSRRAAAAKPNTEMAETALATAPTGHRSGNSSVEIQHGQVKEGSHAPDQSKDVWRKPLFHSLGLAVMMSILLWCSHGELLLAVWRLSLLLVSYFFCWACVLSVSTPKTTMFVYLSYVALLAFYFDAALSPAVGMVIIYLDTVLAAGCFGWTLAEHRERFGTEKAAAAAAAYAPVPANEEEEEFMRASEKSVFLLLGVLTLGCAARVAWVVCPPAGYSMVDIAANLSAALSFLLFFYIVCVLQSLHGAILGEDCVFTVLVWFAAISILALFSCLILGMFGVVIVVWDCVLGLMVFLGYCLRVHASYEQIVRSQLPATPLEELDDYKLGGQLEDSGASRQADKVLLGEITSESDRELVASPARSSTSSSALQSP